MALDQKDIKEIKKIVDDGVEQLAIIVAKGFESVEKRMDNHDKRFDSHDKRFDSLESTNRHILARLDLIETDLSSLRNLHHEVQLIRELLDEVVTRREFEKLEKRLLRVEQRLGLAK